MRICEPRHIIAEVERQGGSVRACVGELLADLPPELQNAAWLALLRQEKATLLPTAPGYRPA